MPPKSPMKGKKVSEIDISKKSIPFKESDSGFQGFFRFSMSFSFPTSKYLAFIHECKPQISNSLFLSAPAKGRPQLRVELALLPLNAPTKVDLLLATAPLVLECAVHFA